MNMVISVLGDLEKLAYKFLLAIIFIPKTIIQITVNPMVEPTSAGYMMLLARSTRDTTCYTMAVPPSSRRARSPTHTLRCVRNPLTLFANSTELYSLTDTKINFKESAIGIGASSPQSLQVDLQFDQLAVSKP